MFRIVLVFALLLTNSAVSEEWKTGNSVVGVISLPESLALGDGRYILDDGDAVVGEEFYDSNGLFLRIRRFERLADKRPRDYLDWAATDPTVTYMVHRSTMSVVSGVDNDDVFYIKCRGKPLRCIELRYPISSKTYLDPVVARIATSFKR